MISHNVDFGLMSQSGQIAHPSTTLCAVLLVVRMHRHASMPSDLPAVARDNVPFPDISLRRRTSLSSAASNGLHTSWMNPDFGRKERATFRVEEVDQALEWRPLAGWPANDSISSAFIHPYFPEDASSHFEIKLWFVQRRYSRLHR